MEHELKIWPEEFKLVVEKKKTYEVRLNDRSFRVGDTLRLREWDYSKGYAIDEGDGIGITSYTGNSVTVKVTQITHLDQFGIRGYVAMQIEKESSE